MTRGLGMPMFAPMNQDHVDYHVLVEPRPDGPVIGYFAGQPIAAAVVDLFGRRFVYEGVAPRGRDGQYDVKCLRKGEWIVEPGLLYHFDQLSLGSTRPAARKPPMRAPARA